MSHVPWADADATVWRLWGRVKLPWMRTIHEPIWRDHQHWGEGHSLRAFRDWRVVERDLWAHAVCVAPAWVAWLYLVLPNHANVNLTAWRDDDTYFLMNVAAPAWRVGLVVHRRLPALKIEIGSWDTYLPWGTVRYVRLVSERRA